MGGNLESIWRESSENVKEVKLSLYDDIALLVNDLLCTTLIPTFSPLKVVRLVCGPWGVGTGDATDELCLNAIHKNYTNLIGHHFNAHNQYLQTLLTVGIPGLIILLTYCFYPLYFSIRKKDMLYLSFAIILIFNLLVESMFEIRAGVQFFAIINVLLWLLSVKKKPQTGQEERITSENVHN